MSNDKRDGIDRFFDDIIDPAVRKVTGALKHVYVPGQDEEKGKHADVEDAVIVGGVSERVEAMTIAVKVGGVTMMLNFNRERVVELMNEHRVTVGQWLTTAIEETETVYKERKLLGGG